MISASSVRAITLSTTLFVRARRIIWPTSVPAPMSESSSSSSGRKQAENKVAQASASWLFGGCFQRQAMPQAAPGFGQPRPMSRLGRAGRPYRPWFRRGPARLRSLCCCASVPWVAMSCARWVSREPRTSAPTAIDRCAVAFDSANLAHCRCPVPSTASAATAGRGVGFEVELMEAWPVGRRNGLSSGSITGEEGALPGRVDNTTRSKRRLGKFEQQQKMSNPASAREARGRAAHLPL